MTGLAAAAPAPAGIGRGGPRPAQAGRHNYYSVVGPHGLLDLLNAADLLKAPGRHT